MFAWVLLDGTNVWGFVYCFVLVISKVTCSSMTDTPWCLSMPERKKQSWIDMIDVLNYSKAVFSWSMKGSFSSHGSDSKPLPSGFSTGPEAGADV